VPSLRGISDRKRDDPDTHDASHGNRKINLEISRAGSDDLLLDIPSLISPSLHTIIVDRTSFNIECATTILLFLSSLNPENLRVVGYSLMPHNLDKYLSCSHSVGALIWLRPEQTVEMCLSSGSRSSFVTDSDSTFF
jgi:hypothetical protein